MAVLAAFYLHLDIQLLLVVYVEIFLILVWNKTKNQLVLVLNQLNKTCVFCALSDNKRAGSFSEDNVMLLWISYVVFKEIWIFVQFVLWMICRMSYFHLHVFVWMLSFLLVLYDKTLAMWLVSDFFHQCQQRREHLLSPPL